MIFSYVLPLRARRGEDYHTDSDELQHHSVVLEPEPADQFCVRQHPLLIDLPIFEEFSELFAQAIRFFARASVQLEVHLQRLSGDASEAAQIEWSGLIGVFVCTAFLLYIGSKITNCAYTH